MSIKTTVTLDEDVVRRVKAESRSRGASFRDTLNDLLRTALLNSQTRPWTRSLRIKPTHIGYREGLNHNDVESLLEFGEGERHR